MERPEPGGARDVASDLQAFFWTSFPIPCKSAIWKFTRDCRHVLRLAAIRLIAHESAQDVTKGSIYE